MKFFIAKPESPGGKHRGKNTYCSRKVLTPVLMVILGIVLVVRPDSASALVGKVLGWVLLVVGIGLLVIVVGVLMAIDRLKPGKLLGDGGNIIDAQ